MKLYFTRGFSLIELMTVVSIIGIVSVIGFSGFNFFLKKSEADVLSSELLRAIHLARSEAVLQHDNVMLCSSADQVNCSDRWKNEYIIRTKDHVIYHFQFLSQTGQLHWRSFPQNRQQLEFLSTGFPRSQNGTFWFCETDASDPAWAIMLNQSGRARRVYPDKAGHIRDDKGVDLTC